MDVVTSYIELGLRLGKHIDGLVDAYFGPAELAETVDAETIRDPAALVSDASNLRQGVADADLDAQRARWFDAQLLGLETVARRLAGEQISFEDEVERCYGVRPTRVPEERFEQAQELMEQALPGSEPLPERVQAWREKTTIPADKVQEVVDSLAADFRARTEAAFGLPAGEGVEFEYVRDEPWSAFNYYLGNLRSRVAVNLDIPLSPDFTAELVPHETYPGHHTEHAWKEKTLIRERGQLEETIVLIGTPQNLIAEGIAGLGPEVLLGEELENVTAEHMAGTGVDYDPDRSRALREAHHLIEDVAGNAAMMLAEGATEEEARAYHRRWRLVSEERAAHSVRFVTDPTWRAYVTTYADGYRLCRDFVAGDSRRFQRLLTEQLTPADLR
jgi:hypothetical protein